MSCFKNRLNESANVYEKNKKRINMQKHIYLKTGISPCGTLYVEVILNVL